MVDDFPEYEPSGMATDGRAGGQPHLNREHSEAVDGHDVGNVPQNQPHGARRHIIGLQANKHNHTKQRPVHPVIVIMIGELTHFAVGFMIERRRT